MEPRRENRKTPHQGVVNTRELSSACLENRCILNCIFGHLKTGDKVVAARVCKLWRDVVYEASMWRDNDSYIDMDNVDMRFMAPSLKRRNITKFKLNSCLNNDATQLLRFIYHVSPIIKSLDMRRLDARINEQILVRAFTWKALPSLETLYMNRQHTSNSVLIKVICERYPHLKSLQLTSSVTDSILTLIGKNLTLLTDLDVLCGIRCTDAGIHNISTCLSHLTSLTIHGSSMTNTGVSHLARLPLRKLSMRYCHDIDENCITAISPLRNSLQSLAIFQCLGVDPNIALHHLDDSGFCLTELEVNVPFVSYATIKDFLQKKACRRLKKIQLFEERKNSALIAASIEENCPELTTLILSWKKKHLR